MSTWIPVSRSLRIANKQAFRAFYGHIQTSDFNGPAPFATFEDGHREVVLCEAVLKSAEKGCWVKL